MSRVAFRDARDARVLAGCLHYCTSFRRCLLLVALPLN
jgi:hypothetical protein